MTLTEEVKRQFELMPPDIAKMAISLVIKVCDTVPKDAAKSLFVSVQAGIDGRLNLANVDLTEQGKRQIAIDELMKWRGVADASIMGTYTRDDLYDRHG
jgi:hypothetical protein